MATPTYDLLDSTTLSSSASSVTFTSIDQSYRDLVIVTDWKPTTGDKIILFRLNGDSGANYPVVYMTGNGTSANTSASDFTFIFGDVTVDTNGGNYIVTIMDYSATDKHKSFLYRANGTKVGASAGRWANTSAVTSLSMDCSGEYAAGSTFYLYGIAS